MLPVAGFAAARAATVVVVELFCGETGIAVTAALIATGVPDFVVEVVDVLEVVDVEVDDVVVLGPATVVDVVVAGAMVVVVVVVAAVVLVVVVGGAVYESTTRKSVCGCTSAVVMSAPATGPANSAEFAPPKAVSHVEAVYGPR